MNKSKPACSAAIPIESFSVIWLQLPLFCSVLLAWPWSVYQLWAFFAPGPSYKERRSAIPFVLLAGGLFIGSSLFAYFVALRSGLEFLLRSDPTADAILSISEYFDLFVDATL